MPHVRPTRRGSYLTPCLLTTRRGFTLVMMAIVLVIIMGCVAMTVDVGRIMVGSQQAQNAADAAAMAAAPLLGNQSETVAEAQDAITANNQNAGEYAVTCDDGDIVYYGPNSTVPGFGALGPFAQAIAVTTHIPLHSTFGAALGLTQTTVDRRAIAVRAPSGGCPIAPMWITAATPYNYGNPYNLLMAHGPHYPDIPGNFSWLDIPSGMDAGWSQVLEGYPPLSEADQAKMNMKVDDLCSGKTGLAVGHWATPLRNRITRGSSGIYAGDTFDDFDPTNPRIILVPLCVYVGGVGTGATFRIVKFGAFWLDRVNSGGKTKSIDGRFIRYSIPGYGDLDADATSEGIYTYRLVG